MGFTPAGKTPTNISNTIDKIYNDRYNTGYNKGYGDGRTQGQQDVKDNPENYGISIGVNISTGMDAFFINCTKISTGAPTKNNWQTVYGGNLYDEARDIRTDGEWLWDKNFLILRNPLGNFTKITYPNLPDYDHTNCYQNDLDVKLYRSDYQSLTINDFWFVTTSLYGWPNGSPNKDGAEAPKCIAYNPSTGKLTVQVYITEDYGCFGYVGYFVCTKPIT